MIHEKLEEAIHSMSVRRAVPVGAGTLGRIINVIGEPGDEDGPVPAEAMRPIHQAAPTYAEQSTEGQILETGIKGYTMP